MGLWPWIINFLTPGLQPKTSLTSTGSRRHGSWIFARAESVRCVQILINCFPWYFNLNFPRLGTGSILKMRTRYLQSPQTPWARPSYPWRPRWSGRIQAFPWLNYNILFRFWCKRFSRTGWPSVAWCNLNAKSIHSTKSLVILLNIRNPTVQTVYNTTTCSLYLIKI